jgi:hypothetical protein
MTYAFGWPLQQAIHAALRSHPDLAALVGDRVHDAAPHRDAEGASEGPYVLIGDERVTPWSTATDVGAAHEIAVAAVSWEPGFATVKRVAGAVCAAMLGPLAPERGRVVSASFLGARTTRRGALRRIDMRFRFAVEDTE